MTGDPAGRGAAAIARPRVRRRLLYVVTEDWYFWSHRRHLAALARTAGWEVALATNVTAHGADIEALGVTLFPMPWRRGGLNPMAEMVTARALAKIIRRYEPDLVHNVALKPILHGLGYPRPLPVVNAVTGVGYAFINADGARWLSPRRWLGEAVRVVLARALARPGSIAVVQNDDDAALCRQLGVHAGNIELIPGVGIDLKAFSPSSLPRRGTLRVALVARMLWDKGVGELVEAARHLRDEGVAIEVELVGGPDPANRASIAASQLERWVAEGIVQWTGWTDDIPGVWARADAAVLPSYREGFPKALIEAAACGRALVATDVPGCRAIVTDGRNGLLVPPRDSVALAEALARLAADRAWCEELGRAARIQAENEFGMAAIGARFDSVYKRMVAS
ncbi:MAG: glycosyltransferase family 4 protein [Pseudomonadota bacterium]